MIVVFRLFHETNYISSFRFRFDSVFRACIERNRHVCFTTNRNKPKQSLEDRTSTPPGAAQAFAYLQEAQALTGYVHVHLVHRHVLVHRIRRRQ
jgi:hypothetical protein